jgi:S-adenosylmethionine:tRNA ribosyltransferase-isomerase
VKTADFDYELPQELIAQTPVEPRDASRLLVLHRVTGRIEHRRFFELPRWLLPGDLLVYNESRVIPARLFARKKTGGKVEILLLRQRDSHTWEALVGGRRIRQGSQLTVLRGPDGPPTGTAVVVTEVGADAQRVLRFDQPVLPLAERVGTTPLPPYIHTPLADAERYQTVYACTPGSAAAPTAGLHFTPVLLEQLKAMGVRSTFVTLHIGLDTFRPVTEERVQDHEIHTEYGVLTPEAAGAIQEARKAGSRVVAVGTTSVRVLETAAIKAETAGHEGQVIQSFGGPTDLFIYPGYRFRMVDTLITNFHLPRSTLLMLVAAFASKELIDRAYAEAIDRRYRFYSFGDAMLIL